MRAPSAKTNNTSRGIPAISIRDCVVAYGDNIVIDGISLDINQGSIAAVIGPNGSGKTTLIKAIIDLVPMKSGDIRILGKHLHSVRQMIGYVPQRFDFDRYFPMTVGEFLDLARRIHCQKHFPASRVEHKLREVGLPKETLYKHLGELSGGQLQRVLIAQALINDPSILFLDEPSAGIDIMGEAAFFEILKHLKTEHDTTIIMVSHDITMISHIVDTVVCVNHKLLCFGSPAEALTKNKIEELFGAHQHPYNHPGHGADHDRKPAK
ncbi:MAG: metal ABC transporter ATP-binding protein [Patescibacteria group bacterium]|jgi:zinc/manganese transport system ATP-binding protein